MPQELPGPWIVPGRVYRDAVAERDAAVGERDRARETAVRLEQELAEVIGVLDSYRYPTEQMDELERARMSIWSCE